MLEVKEDVLKRLELLENKVKELESLIKSEKIITVKEISFEEAKELIENYIKNRKGEITSPLKLSQELQIPYEIAHKIVIELIKEGKAEPVESADLEDLHD